MTMDASTSPFVDGVVTLPAAELRESLENIINAIDASAYSCSEECKALEVQRQRVLTLLSKMDARETPCDSPDTTEQRRCPLLSPSLLEADKRAAGPLQLFSSNSEAGDARTRDEAAEDNVQATLEETGDERTTYVTHSAHRCLLANLFCKPRRRETTTPLNSPVPCLLYLPSKRSLGEHGWNGEDEDDSIQHIEATVQPQVEQLCCSPEARLAFPEERRRRRIQDRHDLPLSFPRRSCSLLKQVSAECSFHRHIESTAPRSFWINVWPCYGSSAASRTHHPARVLVRGRYRYFEDVLEKAAKRTNCKPAPHGFYTPDGCPIRHLHDLVAEHHYLLFPFGGFYRKQSVPTALLWVLYTDARHIVQCSQRDG
ncbi:hypothetical protein, conserved [Leishmania tarentolae]|uniref:Uncharacterized protein n=1 Tax=Leishmania tarentolae TaxID=5689 RepID=A0A640KR36_LEITA|nr:hypothetical protein, conserved [Leishmania tarentolae]